MENLLKIPCDAPQHGLWTERNMHPAYLVADQQPVRLAYQPPASSTFSQNKPVTSNQPAVLFSQNKPALAISHQPTEQGASCN
jgi:hypothetical protein